MKNVFIHTNTGTSNFTIYNILYNIHYIQHTVVNIRYNSRGRNNKKKLALTNIYILHVQRLRCSLFGYLKSQHLEMTEPRALMQ